MNTTTHSTRTVRRSSDEPRVWIGCLACYNEGFLVGQWYDGVEAGDVTTERLHQDGGRILTGFASPDAYRWSPEGSEPVDVTDGCHEELWIFDHEGYSGAINGECSPAEAQRVAELLADVNADESEPLAIYLAHSGEKIDDDTVDNFRDAYRGSYDSEIDYAQQLADDLDSKHRDLPWPLSCIDWEYAARELFMGDYWSEKGANGDLYVFVSC